MATPSAPPSLKISTNVPQNRTNLPDGLRRPEESLTEKLNKRVTDIAQETLVDLALDYHEMGKKFACECIFSYLSGYIQVFEKETLTKDDVQDAIDFARIHMGVS